MKKNKYSLKNFLAFIALVIIIGIGAYFRFSGIDWDEEYHLHPDERFLTMVESSISPVNDLSEYFNTELSRLNPHNSGYGFFVYGTFPIFLVRYLAQWSGATGYGQIYLVGRYLSGLADLITVILVFLISEKLYRNKLLATVAAALASFSVLPIQQAHFFTVDSITNLFSTLSIYFAVCILVNHHQLKIRRFENKWIEFLKNEWLAIRNYVFFGIALGLAAASKINAAVVSILLPVVVLLKEPEIIKRIHKKKVLRILCNLFIAAFFSILIFRIFQPYAFSGPGFFNINPNPKWIENLKELNFLSSGNSNYPPSLQWTRRPVWFGPENIIKFGIGIPFGIIATLSLIWMGWRIARGEWKTHSLLWIWTIVYLIWQSLRWNPTMRYFLPIYPTLAVIAAWGLWQLQGLNKICLFKKQIKPPWKLISIVLTGITVGGTLIWAFAFINIYSRPVTRVSASKWIYRNVESAINLLGESDGEKISFPIAYPHSLTLKPTEPLNIKFISEDSSQIVGIKFDFLVNPFDDGESKKIQYVLRETSSYATIDSGQLSDTFVVRTDPRGDSYVVLGSQNASIEKDKEYELQIFLPENSTELKVSGNVSLVINTLHGRVERRLYKAAPRLTKGSSYTISFTPFENMIVRDVQFFRVREYESKGSIARLRIEITDPMSPNSILASAEISSTFDSLIDYRGDQYLTELNSSLLLFAGKQYLLAMTLLEDDSSLYFYGSQQANETSWDDAIPLLMYNFNVYDYMSGIYQSDINFELYWDDNDQKLTRMQNILDEADYIYITSNRQWGSITQIPERYPLTMEYYRNLLGCPTGKEIQWCYRVAEPGMFTENLGFDLIQVFQSNPQIGKLVINSQFAEEAFTVYDHPKVFIFKKNIHYSSEKVSAVLSEVDLSKVVNLTPAQANKTPGTLELSDTAKEIQYAGGTWSDLFNRYSFINSSSMASMLIWYLTITILGWIVYPVVRIAFGGLSDKGYPATKLAGLLLWTLIVWLASSAGITFNKQLILFALLFLTLFNIYLLLQSRIIIINEIRRNFNHYLRVEFIALGLFVFFLLIRLGNPDLWHPYKGGEKPMDFSYFNAVLKSSIFPPYDPWFADGYINYYYFGFIISAIPVKFLGLIPSVAYNLILPTFFSFSGLGAFCIGWNIASKNGQIINDQNIFNIFKKNETTNSFGNPYLLGCITLLLFLIFGNLGTLRMMFHGLQRLASGAIPIEMGNIIQRIIWTFAGIAKFIGGQNLSYYPGDWYWIPSRTIPGEPITEFPYFTFLYGDPHAHLFALPITLMVLLWCISLLKYVDLKNVNKWGDSFITILFGAVIVGALRPTNTWDFPTYLIISTVLLFYASVRNKIKFSNLFEYLSSKARIFLTGFCLISLFAILSILIYLPFSKVYGQAYTAFDFWKGDHTPINSYVTHWGLFLFITISWIFWEIREWMANTPLSALNQVLPFKKYIFAIILSFFVLIFFLLLKGIQISILVLPIMTLQVLLVMRKSQSDLKRFITAISVIGLGLTFLVEIVVLRGDIGRMNTVFKLYLQAWTMLSISSAIYFFWLIKSVFRDWKIFWQRLWMAIIIILIISVALFPLIATVDKISDRISTITPITLDGMDFMKYATYMESGIMMDLSQDYGGIQWMQDNVIGSPIIVEANVSEYRWGNRYSIYTGLPGVIGWNWHQRQQRAIVPSEWITNRIYEVGEFYSTKDISFVKKFLHKYQVQYIVVGQLEEIIYSKDGITKFKSLNGELWDCVYQNKDTSIYQVRESTLK